MVDDGDGESSADAASAAAAAAASGDTPRKVQMATEKLSAEVRSAASELRETWARLKDASSLGVLTHPYLQSVGIEGTKEEVGAKLAQRLERMLASGGPL